MLPTLEEMKAIYRELNLEPCTGSYALVKTVRRNGKDKMVCDKACLAGALYAHKAQVNPLQVFSVMSRMIAQMLGMSTRELGEMTMGFDAGFMNGLDFRENHGPLYEEAYKLGKGLREEYELS